MNFNSCLERDCSIHRLSSQLDNPPNIEFSPYIKRGFEIVKSLGKGAWCGYACYWGTRLAVKLGMLVQPSGFIIRPLPYILSGIISAAIVETAYLTYNLVLPILGDREKIEKLVHSENVSGLDRLRQRTWKIITSVENLQQSIDKVFSRAFGIRLSKEIEGQNLPDHQLSNLEIFRRVFIKQIPEIFKTAVSQELGLCCVEALGYTILGGHAFVWISSLAGLMDNIIQVFLKVKEEENTTTSRNGIN